MDEVRHYCLIAPLAYTGPTSGGLFTYHSDELMPTGSIVEIPIGRRHSLGVIVDQVQNKPDFPTRGVTSVLPLPILPGYLIRLAAWMSDFYAASPSAVWNTFLPTGLNKKRRTAKDTLTFNTNGLLFSLPSDSLTPEQQAALASIRQNASGSYLLKGVTGSGKTRIYLELAAEALAAGRSVVILVPEITLTPQLASRFEAVFGSRVLITHSKLTESQRDRIWRIAATAATNKQPLVIVGPRSSLFLPLHEPGLIVIDECHESSYKQDQHPRYQSLTAAAKLGRLTGARLVMGSATPGLVEYHLALSGRISLVELHQRVAGRPLPRAAIIDLRDKNLTKTSPFISAPLGRAVADTLASGRQTLLYINRRGSASSQICGDCGHVTICPDCRLPMTFHADLMKLICHHCDRRSPVPAVCPECAGANMRLLGGGTKRIESEVAKLWPEARIARFDRDSIVSASDITAMHHQLIGGDFDIIIGTQMIAKGLDLPAVDTVGVVSADTMLHLPDFSAAERTFQLLTQVAGRAGRGDHEGRVYIQTYNPDHPAIVAAASHDFDSFAAGELANRKSLGYPPYSYLLKLTATDSDQNKLATEMSGFANLLRQHNQLKVSGPAPAFLEYHGGRYHWIISVTSPSRQTLVQIARQLPGEHWTADLDPANLL